jgi:hypothetical protein
MTAHTGGLNELSRRVFHSALIPTPPPFTVINMAHRPFPSLLKHASKAIYN